MKSRKRERMKKRADRFVVGYMARLNIVRGRSTSNGQWRGFTDATRPMALSSARRMLKTMPCADCAIFELVPVEVNR